MRSVLGRKLNMWLRYEGSFLAHNQLNITFSTLLYICETGDKKQALRNRLFERWFSTFERKAQYTFVASSLLDDEDLESEE